MKSPRPGISALSQICSGRRPLSPASASMGVRKLLRDVSPPGGELVVGALAGQQWPGATDAGSVEWRAVRVFAVPSP